MNAQPMAGDILCFVPDPHDKTWFGYALDTSVILGEMLEHPGIKQPLFYHVGIMLDAENFAQENGICHQSTLSSLPASQALWLKRLPLTPDQREAVPAAARALYGTRYDVMLDAYLGLRYLWHGATYALQRASGGLIRIQRDIPNTDDVIEFLAGVPSVFYQEFPESMPCETFIHCKARNLYGRSRTIIDSIGLLFAWIKANGIGAHRHVGRKIAFVKE